MSERSLPARLARRPAAAVADVRVLRAVALAGVVVAAGGRIAGGDAGIVGLWALAASAFVVTFALPRPVALVAPLYAGLAGWVFDMLPFIVLVGWAAAVLRWAAELAAARRLPRGGRWVLLPAGLALWTALGAVVVSPVDFRHFLLLLGIQGVASGVVLAAVDWLREPEQREQAAAVLVGFAIALSGGVFLQWIGIDVERLQDSTARERVEAYYGLDAFPNNIGMIKYARSIKAGAGELRGEIVRLSRSYERFPDFKVFRPKFQAFESRLVVRFRGSARPYERDLDTLGVRLLYDSVGIAPANTVPRLRSFPRNALTFAGVCAALLPVAFYLAWTGGGRRRLIGRAGVAATLFGAGFSLARGAWAALMIGIVYLLVDGAISGRRKLEVVAAYAAAAVVLTAVFLVKYEVDPLTGRAGGGASVNTRADLYADTVDSLTGVHLFLGFGTERPRTSTGTVREGTRYVPRAGTHSTYLNYLFRTGVPGALGIAALYAVAALHARAAGRLVAGSQRLFATMVAAAVVIAAAHGLILSLYVEPVYTLTVSLLLGFAIAGAVGLPGSVLPWRTRSTRG